MTTTTATAPIETLKGFVQEDFNVFHLQGLDERMAAIEENIRPKFRAIGGKLAEELSVLSGREMHLHIARHARRTVNPPKDTWLAICDNKRGYKAHPHFQLGLFDDHLFLWLAFIYELPNKKMVAQRFLDDIDEVIATVPGDYALSLDHMKKDSLQASSMSRDDWQAAITRFRDVQKAELLIGRHYKPEDALVQNGEALLQDALGVYRQLLPLYQSACAL